MQGYRPRDLIELGYTGDVWNVLCEIEGEGGDVWFPEGGDVYFPDREEAIAYAKEAFSAQALASILKDTDPEFALGVFVHVVLFDCNCGKLSIVGDEPYYLALERDEIFDE